MGSVDRLLDQLVDTLEVLRGRVNEYRSALDRAEMRNRELEAELAKYRERESKGNSGGGDEPPMEDEHYKPGDTIKIQRIAKIGDFSVTGFTYARENYDACVKNMIKHGMLFLESDAPESPLHNEKLFTVDINKVIGKGRVI